MKLKLVPIIVLALLPSFAFANGFTRVTVESQNTAVPALLTLTSYTLEDGKLGISSFFQVAPGWAQAYAGPTWSPSKGRQLGMSLGLEQCDGSYGIRYAGFGWFMQGPVSGILVVETNNTLIKGLWYDAWLRTAITHGIEIGIHARRGAGSGVELHIEIPKTKLSAFATWMFMNQETWAFTPDTSLIGVFLTL